jgi:hypothetical protein
LQRIFVCLFCKVIDAAAVTASCSGGDWLVVDSWFVPSVDPTIKINLFIFSSGFGFQFSRLSHGLDYDGDDGDGEIIGLG